MMSSKINAYFGDWVGDFRIAEVVLKKKSSVVYSIMHTIDKNDIDFVKKLSARQYVGNSMSSNSTEEERERFKKIKHKLKNTADFFIKKFSAEAGPFDLSVSSGNPIMIGKKTLNRVWSGISKGAENKQYAAQISFVINTEKLSLDVGFYFGRASGHMLSREMKLKLEAQLASLGKILSHQIENNYMLAEFYQGLFDYGFKASSFSGIVNPTEWLARIKTTPQHSQIVMSLEPDAFGEISFSTLDLCVAMLMPLLGAIPEFDNKKGDVKSIKIKRFYKPLTAEQRAKQAEWRTLIGDKGEEFVMQHEQKKIADWGLDTEQYPDWISKKSMTEGYDILSCDENENEVMIEVKSTTRLQRDPEAYKFHISSGEYYYYINNKDNFRIYRVFDIEGNPSIEVINLDEMNLTPSHYLVSVSLPSE